MEGSVNWYFDSRASLSLPLTPTGTSPSKGTNFFGMEQWPVRAPDLTLLTGHSQQSWKLSAF
jgi:hypothetical protein